LCIGEPAVSTNINDDIQDVKDAITALDKKLDKLVTTVDNLKSAQDLFATDMQKLKDPDNGIYPRIRSLEQWKDTQSKFMWIFATTTVGIIIKQIWGLLTVGH